jgi:DNA modification methylase
MMLGGDVRRMLVRLPAASVQCCVTSPPYFGLRDYGHERQIGVEPSPDDYVDALVDVFRAVQRVLRDDGTLWLNLGDSYNSGPSGGLSGSTLGGGQANQAQSNRSAGRKCQGRVTGLKHKDLIGIPWRVAFALQADGWYLRQDIIWHKPNPMPESVTDRCTKAHEYIFLLTKSDRYYFDAEAVKEPAAQPDRVRADRFGGNKYVEGVKHSDGSVFTGSAQRNRRSVWTVTPKPFKGAHFATFPPALVEPCILAGSRSGDIVLDPFGGSGTTALVSRQHGRLAVYVELNPEYIEIARARLTGVP